MVAKRDAYVAALAAGPPANIPVKVGDCFDQLQSDASADVLWFADVPYFTEALAPSRADYQCSTNWGYPEHKKFRDAIAAKQHWVFCHSMCAPILELYAECGRICVYDQGVTKLGASPPELLVFSHASWEIVTSRHAQLFTLEHYKENFAGSYEKFSKRFEKDVPSKHSR